MILIQKNHENAIAYCKVSRRGKYLGLAEKVLVGFYARSCRISRSRNPILSRNYFL